MEEVAEDKDGQSLVPLGSHILMQPPVMAASRRPEIEEVAGKSKRGSDDGSLERDCSYASVHVEKYERFQVFPAEEGSCCGSSFFTFLSDLEQEGIVACHHGDVPPRLKGVCGWTVFDDKMDEWKRRRQAWFMQGKEGKPYKANSFYQFLRRLGFFPTEVTKRASHGLDFDGSRSFKWDGSRRHKYIQSKKEKQQLSGRLHSDHPGRALPRGRAAPVCGGLDMGASHSMVMGTGWQTPMEPPGRPLPVYPGASSMAGANGVAQGPWESLQAQGMHYSAPAHIPLLAQQPLPPQGCQHPAYPAASSASGSTLRSNGAGGGEHLA